MKLLVISCVLMGVLVVCLADDKYTTKYDNVDLDQILQSDRLLRNYVNCLLEKGKCTPDGVELKKNLPDALENGCQKCTDTQQKGARKVIHFLIKNKREWWNELAAKYDPDGTYTKKYEEEIKKENLNI
ncbi:ejaculatory bulb-specific protein 3-like [Anthonomus grandis grandis]|uniref:ejaculatory bulb-specific protein 3-like n=1 Tax=Anthonomus grandis grandis TaxID=2921223 RepID=UPI00216533C2|nr:ejaculatory bulb-specific protein 3-like [Anthonomus grandis grandis]